MRGLVKSWSDQKPFKRRVRWYDTADHRKPINENEAQDIRLCFEDGWGKQNWYYKDVASAQVDWDSFKHGTLTVAMIFGRRQ